MLNSEGLKIMMLKVLEIAIQDYKSNIRAIARYDKKIYESVDLDETIDFMRKKSELIGENKAIEKFVLDRNNIVYGTTNIEPTYFIKLFKQEIMSDDDKK